MNIKRYTMFKTLMTGILLFNLFISPANAQVINVTDSILTNTTWDCDVVNLNYWNIVVANGVTLTIMPGTEVRYNDGAVLRIHGCLKALGTADQRIKFTSGNINYRGIGVLFQNITQTNDTSIIQYCDFTDLGNNSWPILLIDRSNKVKIDHVNLYNNTFITGGGKGILELVGLNYCDINYCKIFNNKGNGININSCNQITLKNLDIYNNKYINVGYEYLGTGIRCGNSQNIKIFNSTIYNNLSYKLYDLIEAGGLYVKSSKIELINTTIANNNTDTIGLPASFGGAIYSDHSKILLHNCILSRNIATYGNQINTNYGDTIIFKYTHIPNAPNTFASGTNINSIGNSVVLFYDTVCSDPLFCNTGEYPYRLSHTSPCRNAGNPAFTADSVKSVTDIIGLPRIFDDTIDMGAYEWNPAFINKLASIDTLLDENYDSSFLKLNDYYQYQYNNNLLSYQILANTQNTSNYSIAADTLNLYSLPDEFGKDTLKLKIYDGTGNEITDTVYLEINNLPEFTSQPITGAYPDSVYHYNITGLDEDGDSIWFEASEPIPFWLNFANTGTSSALLSGDVPTVFSDTLVQIQIKDGRLKKEVLQEFPIHVWHVSVKNNNEKNVRIYPIPAKDVVILENINACKKILLYDITGNLLQSIDNTENKHYFHIHNLAKGIYTIALQYDDTILYQKIVKE